MSKSNKGKEKLLKRMTQKMEEYLMPKYNDQYPAMDVLQIIIDSGYAPKEDVGELVDTLINLLNAVKYVGVLKNYGTEENVNFCWEARVPTGFVNDAEQAIAKFKVNLEVTGIRKGKPSIPD